MNRDFALILTAFVALCLVTAGVLYTYLNDAWPYDSANAATDPTEELEQTPEPEPQETWPKLIDGVLVDENGIKYNPETGERLSMLALTFDDGPSPTITPLLLSTLEEHGVHATFFMLGQRVADNPELAAAAAAGGNQIASHGWDHKKSFTKMTDAELADNISRTAQAIEDAVGVPPAYIRPPYGAIDSATAAKIEFPLMLWNIDPRDWDTLDAAKVRDAIVNNAFDGGVVILHDNYQSTVDGVAAAIDILQEQGWQFVTLDQYYQIFGIEPQPGVVYRGTATADLS